MYVCFTSEEFEDTKEVIRVRKSKKDRQHNGQKKKDKRTNNDLQNITHKTKDRVKKNMNPTKNRRELMCFGRVSSCCSTGGTPRKKCTKMIFNYNFIVLAAGGDIAFTVSSCEIFSDDKRKKMTIIAEG